MSDNQALRDKINDALLKRPDNQSTIDAFVALLADEIAQAEARGYARAKEQA